MPCQLISVSSTGAGNRSEVRREGRLVVGVEMFPHFDHVTAISSVLQRWEVESLKSFRIAHRLHSINQLRPSDLHVFKHLDVFAQIGSNREFSY